MSTDRFLSRLSFRFNQIVRHHSTIQKFQWPSSRVRQTFIDYFIHHPRLPHVVVPSSSVLPPKDSGTYFVNSGMNQFKHIFLAQRDDVSITQRRITNYQKCIRVGGKHNDLADVGHDTYHHTFFEMLGNWSFNGAYFKREACTMAFDLLTRVYGIEKNRLFFTYFQGKDDLVGSDEETRQIWLDLGVDAERLLPFGMKENFWEMGETGPCGPCTEIHYDHTGDGDPSQVNRDNPRVVEVWNLVFMQYERRQDKSLIPLSQFHVDTGMGLERLVAVLNSSESNYDTDLFIPLFDAIHSHCSFLPVYTQANNEQQYAYRLLADHARMCTIAIGDGLVPEKKGIGGILKKMIERAARIAHERLQIDEARVGIVSKLIPIATQILIDAYPELNGKVKRTMELVQRCELNYMNKYQLAKPLLERFIDEKLRGTNRIVSGSEIYRLYAGKFDDINVPLEMIEDYTRSIPSLTIDWTDFDALMREETRKSRAFSVYNKTIRTSEMLAHHPTEKLSDLLKQQSESLPATVDSPYKYQEAKKSIEASVQLIIRVENEKLQVVTSVDSIHPHYLLLDRTNFYSNAGGQPSDHGRLEFSENQIFHVEHVFRLHEYLLHYGYFSHDGHVSPTAICHVDTERRLNLSRNHTATHLVNKLLRDILNDSDLVQRASLIHEDYFIFEYSSVNILKTDTIVEQLEQRIEELILLDLPISVSFHDYASIRSDARFLRLTNELYPSEVRCINIGSTLARELCCGTHLSSTGQLDDFLIVRVDSKGNNNKRIYCLTGPFARHVRVTFENDFQQKFHRLERDKARIPLDELYVECQQLRQTYLDDKSLMMPIQQRTIYLDRWRALIPDRKLLRKWLTHQFQNQNYIQSKVNLSLYDIGYMLLRCDDEHRKHLSHLMFVHRFQRQIIVLLNNTRQRDRTIQEMQERFGLILVREFDDDRTRELFTLTKKLLVFRSIDEQNFDRIDFDRIMNDFLL